jgi:hypothetical protein
MLNSGISSHNLPPSDAMLQLHCGASLHDITGEIYNFVHFRLDTTNLKHPKRDKKSKQTKNQHQSVL